MEGKNIVSKLFEILSTQNVLYAKLRNYHWNVRGPLFGELHRFFEKLYEEIAEDIDRVAERMRALDEFTPATLTEFLENSSIRDETPGHYPTAKKMVSNLVDDYETLINQIRAAVVDIQAKYADEVTANMLIELAEKYEKNRWMLKSYIER
jgi:starvation-inducible DNA-binding protein